jgi:hypothetical protein
MKSFLLTATALFTFAGSLFAQNLITEYSWELGANIGASTITRPLGPADPYQGTRTKIVADYSLRLNYYINPNWLLNVDIGSRKWESFGTWQEPTLFGQNLPTRQVAFLEASHAISENAGISYVVPFYDKYNRYNSANLYFGATIGLINTINDGSTSFSVYKTAPDSGIQYLSGYNYSSGMGYSFGLQTGFTYYILPRLGVNIDLAVRYAHIKTIEDNWRSENATFYLLYFPETIGVRWRF